MSELYLLRLLLNEENYNNYYRYVNKRGLSQEALFILTDYQDYRLDYPGDIELNRFALWFHQYKHPELGQKQHQLYDLIFSRIEETKDQPADECLQAFQAGLVKDNLQKSWENGFDVDYMRRQLDEYDEFLGRINQSDREVRGHITDIRSATDRASGLHWRLNCLNEAIGPIIKGDFIIVGAFVDTGKSAFAASEASYMARQVTDGCVVWFNNEEKNLKVWSRIWCATLGKSWEYICQVEEEKAQVAYTTAMNGDENRIRFFDIEDCSMSEVRAILKKLNPRLIIIDQTDKIRGGQTKEGAEHNRLKWLYGQARAIAKEYAPVIAISQADATSSWKDAQTGEVKYRRWLDQTHLDGSKVGKPGEADAIVMIGRDKDYPASRYLHVCKNKLNPIREELRYGKFEVYFDNATCRYTDSEGI